MQVLEHIKHRHNTINELFENNADSILAYNANMLITLICAGMIMLVIPVLAAPFSESKIKILPLYLICIVVLYIMLLAGKYGRLKERPLLGIRLLFCFAFLFSIYLSIVHSPHERATIILGLFCIFPTCIMDKPCRVLLFSSAVYLIHTGQAFIYKDTALALDDAVNALCFLLLGNILGNRITLFRLNTFETKRQLALEIETDDLMRIKNRRKLFEKIEQYEKDRTNAPSAVIMIDIDDFKEYNDKFGHAVGDQLLSKVGETLLSYEDVFHVEFYRYGGEEFAGFAWGYTLQELRSILEALKISLNSISVCEKAVGVSIGIVDCSGDKQYSYKTYIQLADKALYTAKTEGKNRVVGFSKDMISALSNPGYGFSGNES